MSNNEKYDSAFCETFKITKDKLPGMTYGTVSAWDSVAHMELMAVMEDSFDITLEMDDIVDFSSYEKGKEILKKYGVAF